VSTQERLRARFTVPGDPRPRLGVDVEHWLDHKQAATALALALANEPMIRTGRNALQQGLNRAMTARLLDDAAAVKSAPKAVVQGYMDALDKHRKFFFKPDNIRVTDNEPVTRSEVRHLFTLDEAATALTLVYEGEPVIRWGRNTVIRALREAAQDRLLDAAHLVKYVDQRAVRDFRQKLIDLVPEFREFHAAQGQAKEDQQAE
jgi:hypothetical protein